jgi:hypothetical protein
LTAAGTVPGVRADIAFGKSLRAAHPIRLSLNDMRLSQKTNVDNVYGDGRDIFSFALNP